MAHNNASRQITGSPSSRCEELLFFQKNPYAERPARETSYRDIVTAVIYCYVTLASQYVEVLCYNGLNLQRFVWGKTLKGILAEILIFFQ